MTRRSPRPCAEPGCPELVPGGRCPEHQRPGPRWQGSTQQDRTRKSGYRRQAANKRTLRRFMGVCHVCGRPGANQVDHVVPLAEGGADDESNRRPIHATPCHAEKSKAEAARARWKGAR